MSEMIDISKLKKWSKPHKVFIQSEYGMFVKREDIEKLLEISHNSDYAKCEHDFEPRKTWVHTCKKCGRVEIEKGHFA